MSFEALLRQVQEMSGKQVKSEEECNFAWNHNFEIGPCLMVMVMVVVNVFVVIVFIFIVFVVFHVVGSAKSVSLASNPKVQPVSNSG